MMTTLPRNDIPLDVDVRPVDEVQTDDVSQDPSASAHILLPHYTPALLMQARVEGTTVQAWCGYRWIPSRDARNLPMCAPCVRLHAALDGRPLEYS